MPQKHKTILLVDDEDSQRHFMSRALENAGYNVLEGANYDEALVIHEQNRGKIDVLVTDISLPGANGYVLARALLDREPHMNVVFISAVAGSELCRYYGMTTTDVHFLGKPFNSISLLRRIQLVMEAGGPYLVRTA